MLPGGAGAAADEPEFVTNVMRPIVAQQGDSLPVSAFRPDGIFPVATTKYEKRGVAIVVPGMGYGQLHSVQPSAPWSCPHAAIRPVLLTDAELADAPEGFDRQKSRGKRAQRLSFPRAGQYPGLPGLR